MIKKCPKCKSDQIITGAGCCSLCGTNVAAAGSEEGDQLDLVVREVPEDDREFVGGSKTGNPGDQPEKGELKPPFKDKKGSPEDESSERHRAFTYDPIGFSEPTLPPEAESGIEHDKNVGSKPIEKPKIPEAKGAASAGQFKKLTPEEIKAIEKNLYGRNVKLADKEKASIRSKINEIESQATSLSPSQPKSEKLPLLSETLNPVGSESTATGRGRSVAYFYKNFIKLPGQQHLTKHDELTLNGKLFVLQPKRVKPTYVYVGAAVVFAALLFIVSSWFIRDAADGKGQIAGIVLDNDDKPFLKGASVRFPDLGVTVKSNAQGLFTADNVPAGAHRVEYLVDGRVIGADHATVLDQGISMVALRPSTTKAEIRKQSQQATRPRNLDNNSETASNKQTSPNFAADLKNTTQTKSEPPSKQSPKADPNAPGAIVLEANVDGAKFSLDGNIIGAGNLKYSPIKPGTYKYEVSASGYKKATGTLTLAAGETKTLEVKLETPTEAAKTATFGAEDYFQSGVTALKADKFDKAVADFTKALELNPSYPQATYNRGLAYQQLKKTSEAHDDFVRAAEVYKVKKEYSWAITSYNRALDINKSSVPALLGRGELYLAKGEEIAALADFDEVLKSDKRSYQSYLGMGRARFQQSNYRLAVENFKSAKAINKDDPYLYQYLMLSYMALNDFKEVKKSYDRFVELASENQRKAMENDKRFTAAIEMARRQQ